MGIDRTPKLVAGQKAVIVLEIKSPIDAEDFDKKLHEFLKQFTAQQSDRAVPLAARLTTLVTSFVQAPQAPPQ